MRRLPIVAAVAAAALAFTAGCGESEENTAAIEELRDQITELSGDARKAERKLAAAEACEKNLRAFMRELRDLDSLLEVGLNFDDHTDRVQQIAIAYNRISFRDLDFGCISAAGLDAEKAYRQFAKADDIWGACIEDFDCDLDSVDPQLQTHWNRAGELVDSAARGLDRMMRTAEEELQRLERGREVAENKLAELESE